MNCVRLQARAEHGSYRLSEERCVVARIRAGDCHAARDLLDRMVSRILQSPGERVEEARIRIAELFVVVSRAIIESGGPEEEVLKASARCIERIMSSRSVPALYSLAAKAFEAVLQFAGDDFTDPDLAVVRRACDVMAARYGEKLSVKEIAGAVYVSPHHLCRLFRRELSQSVMEHLTTVRIGHARRLLETTWLRVSEIARLVGLTNSAHFCRVFKRCTGLSPAQYRRLSGGPVGCYDGVAARAT